ncbi:MAG: HepT-like ribonuclease domain-containing protein [Devosia sp.]|jgi:uncharacterized protein YutE (UPF0331/DUF86 family)
MSSPTEKEVLQQEADRLTAEGYEVFLQPGPSLMPVFLHGYTPDAVAYGHGRKIALEVASPVSRESSNLRQLAALFGQHKDWDFRVLWAEPQSSPQALPAQSPNSVRTAIDEIVQLRRQGLRRPAFLLGWATLEAISRSIAQSQFEKPQTPGRLIQVLAQEGYLTPDAADRLRDLASLRNQLVHGALDADVSDGDLAVLLSTLDSLSSELTP